MIIRIDNKKASFAQAIRDIFQASYAVEAALLQAIDFPPLKRTITDFLNSDTIFYAYYIENTIGGIIEVRHTQESTHIQSLVVYPKYFRKGIGRKLVQFVLQTHMSLLFTVETGADNYPAIQLYKRLGFEQDSEFDTDHGIKKVSFKKAG